MIPAYLMNDELTSEDECFMPPIAYLFDPENSSL